MKGRKNLLFKLSFLTLLGVLIAVPLTSCGFSVCVEGCGFPIGEDASLKDLTSSVRNVVFEEQGTIIVYHGIGCAESNKPGEEDVLKVEESLDLPAYATNATVFLNGWRVQYLDKDHEVEGLGTVIGNIRLERNTLKWQAAGVLRDKNFDDAYSWCYHYTAVAWNPSSLNLTVDHKDGSCDPDDPLDPSQANFFYDTNEETTTARSSQRKYFYGTHSETTTAISFFPSFLQNPVFAAGKTVAVPPRGFGFGWLGCDDHHLLQMGYNLDHSETFIEIYSKLYENGKKYRKKDQDVIPSLPNTASRVDSGFVSWETSAIIKDNARRRDYGFGEMVSGLGGNDVGIIQPPFSIVPEEDDCDGSVGPVGVVRTEEFVIENVPFEFAIPMLTGWELGYLCDDEHVKDMGIWIDEWGYDKNTRTLRYKLSSILTDKDDYPGHYYGHKVTVLGLRPLAGVSPQERVPDLVPFSPSGNSAAAFCRMEEGGKLLRVSVKNQGNADAGISKTTVMFGDTPVTVDTPAIPAGGSVDLLFKVPANCFSPDCSFRITVDSDNQVDESNNEGNNSVGGGCIG
ncbi:MAG TPA: CARDB domain-containing protein [Thermodesulfobacteriota bacterium]|nr:CARDB domain-containing protein [Thermodesulfobacteriota bacterium]